MKIIVCNSKVPFAHGGSELLVQWLIAQLRQRKCEVEEIAIPLMWKTEQDILKTNLIWKLLNLFEALEYPADIIIATKFPSYLAKHARKVIWLFHQFKQIYEVSGSELHFKWDSTWQTDIRNKIISLDNNAFGEAHKIFAISGNVRNNLKIWNACDSEVLYPFPPDKDNYKCESYDDYILHVGRLERSKRIELILEALHKSTFKIKIIFAGDGTQRIDLERKAVQLGLSENIKFLGRIERNQLMKLYAHARAIIYAALNEDFSLIPTEAFLCKKPVIITSDSGGALEIVKDSESGIVSEPNINALARGIEMAIMNKKMLAEMGNKGFELINNWSWDNIIEKLTS